MNNSKWFSRALSCVIVLGVMGCQTPAAVYDLAEKTTANAGVLQSHLRELSESSKALATDRAAAVVSMEAFNAEVDAYIKRELYMRQQSNSSAEWQKMQALMNKLTALRDELIRIEQSARIAEQERRQQILARRTELDTYAAAMRETASALSALAQRESSEERARFIGNFLVDVRQDVDTALQKTDKTSQAANALLKEVEGHVKDDSAQVKK
jgi:hypothetical protein